MSQLKNTDCSSNVGGGDDSGIDNREQKTKKPYPLNASHRFEAPEEGPATDYESEQKETRDWKRLHEEVFERQRAFDRQHEQIKKMQEMRVQFKPATNQNETTPQGALFLIGIACIVGSTLYMLSEGLGTVPIIIIVIGVVLLVGLFLAERGLRKDK